MKNKIVDVVKSELKPDAEAYAFLMLSGKLGERFLETSIHKRKIEDYGRLMGICMIFDFRRMFMRIIREGGIKNR